jgi:hypothetical protein
VTTAPQQDWVQQSIIRLEALEAQREQLAATGPAEKLAEVEGEIRALYEMLEAVAEDGEDPAANASPPAEPTPAPAPAAVGIAAPAAHLAAPLDASDSPFGAPPVAVAAPLSMGSPSMSAGASAMDSYASYDDDTPRGSKAPWIIVSLLLVGGLGAGGWYMFGRTPEQPKAPAPSGPVEVISASEIPEDTQEPNAAKGADVDRAQGTVFKEGSKSGGDDRRASSGTRTGGSSEPRSDTRSDKKDADHGIKVEKSKDPLSGV